MEYGDASIIKCRNIHVFLTGKILTVECPMEKVDLAFNVRDDIKLRLFSKRLVFCK